MLLYYFAYTKYIAHKLLRKSDVSLTFSIMALLT